MSLIVILKKLIAARKRKMDQQHVRRRDSFCSNKNLVITKHFHIIMKNSISEMFWFQCCTF